MSVYWNEYYPYHCVPAVVMQRSRCKKNTAFVCSIWVYTNPELIRRRCAPTIMTYKRKEFTWYVQWSLLDLLDLHVNKGPHRPHHRQVFLIAAAAEKIPVNLQPYLTAWRRGPRVLS